MVGLGIADTIQDSRFRLASQRGRHVRRPVLWGRNLTVLITCQTVRVGARCVDLGRVRDLYAYLRPRQNLLDLLVELFRYQGYRVNRIFSPSILIGYPILSSCRKAFTTSSYDVILKGLATSGPIRVLASGTTSSKVSLSRYPPL